MHSDFATGLTTAPPERLPARVCVQAPARIHLGFLDPAGTLGRSFGSLGLALAGPQTVVELAESEVDTFEACAGGDAALERACVHLETLRSASGCRTPVALRVRSALPAHAGLGSGTQLAVAVGRAFCTAFDIPWGSMQVARVLGRGTRSGVGIAAFDRGGLLLDGGPQEDGSPALVLARIALPAAWRVLLVLDPRVHGLSGTAERAALARLQPLPRAVAAAICHEVLMRVLPGAAGGEFGPFAAGVGHMQQLLGQHFAPAQDGRLFTSEAVGRLLHWIAGQGHPGIGQSSWGPAGFAFLPSEVQARSLLAAAHAAGVVDPALELLVIRARNHSALVSDERARGG